MVNKEHIINILYEPLLINRGSVRVSKDYNSENETSKFSLILNKIDLISVDFSFENFISLLTKIMIEEGYIDSSEKNDYISKALFIETAKDELIKKLRTEGFTSAIINTPFDDSLFEDFKIGYVLRDEWNSKCIVIETDTNFIAYFWDTTA